ncbi:type I polyketide synthase [Amycolatopsis sp. NPDC005232]|uniref:type I polyketide synthase n=1 Tax=Amycolatopsis sp. NPDC005232 TaxID=3157027 RepID=UPI0033A59156
MSEEAKLREYLKRAIADGRNLQRRLQELEGRAAEPVAIVAMACRFPGGVRTPEDLWQLVADGRDAITPFPADRGWPAEDLYPDESEVDGEARARTVEGGFLADAGGFDAGFFGVSPREALAMDPQQRLLLEVSWEAVERAGIDPSSLHGSRTGVYVGGMSQDFGGLLATSSHGDEGHLLTGGSGSVLSGRLSYTFGWEGPAVTLDTACSSSLVGLHLAAQALRGDECDLALAGGVTVMSTPGVFLEFSRQGGLAADGRCKAFSAAANGTGWSEGVGMVVLERLADARRHNHRILALVRGSAINQDGASNGLTAPHGPSQERVIRDALAVAGLDPSEVDAVEAHGTGTTLGDPIEAHALLATYGRHRDTPLLLGSLKSNIGHTQYAAGVAGVIKMVESLRHGVLPATLHADEPSREVDWTAGAVELLTEARDWPETGRPRRVGVSSFGMSGTNAHVVLEQAPEETAVVPVPPDGEVLLSLSAVTGAALSEQAAQLGDFLTAHPEVPVADVAHSLAAGRARFEHRAVVIGDRARVPAALSALAEDTESPDVVRGVVSGSGGVAGVFAGQGGQWVGMGRALGEASPMFAESMAACEEALSPYVDWSLSRVLDDPDAMARVSVVQPVSWAVAVSLAALWAGVGVVPSVVVGHSQGEIAAACVAGALSLADAARIVAVRSALIERSLSGLGTMGSIAWPAERVEEAISTLGLAGVGVAAVNSLSAVIVSGTTEDLDALVAYCANDGARARRIPVDYASHSAQVEIIADELRTALNGITPRDSTIPMISTVTGQRIDTTTLDADYWVRNLRSTVRFADAVTTITESGFSRFLEISAHPVLTTAVEETAGTPALHTLTRDHGDLRQWLTAVATAHAAGLDLTLPQPAPGSGRPVDLPTYPFQHQHFWITAGTSTVRNEGGHPLLGMPVEVAGTGTAVWTGTLSASTPSWLADHRVVGTVLFPGTAFAELAAWAGERLGCATVRELTLSAPLVLAERSRVELQLFVDEADDDGSRRVTLHSRPAGDPDPLWTLHAEGVLEDAGEVAEPAWPGAWPPAVAEPADVDELYSALHEAGLGYGPTFRAVRAAWRAGDEVYAEVALPDTLEPGAFAVHPALLDAALHPLGGPGTGAAHLPFSWTGLRVHATGARALRVHLSRDARGGVTVRAYDGAGLPVVTVESLVLRPAQLSGLGSAAPDPLYDVRWKPVSAGESGGGPVVLLRCPDKAAGDVADLAYEVTGWTVAALRNALAQDEPAVVVVTRRAAAVADEDVHLTHAPITGLVRSAQAEHPGRIVLLDLDDSTEPDAELVNRALATGEPVLAVRDGRLHAPRLGPARPAPGTLALPPAGESAWRLDCVQRGSLDGLAVVANAAAAAPLAPGEVRIAVRAAGVNFRDVLIALDVYPGAARPGSEGAGVVVEVGSAVTRFAPGDRVMGMFDGAFAPVAVCDERTVVAMPDGWSFAAAAAVPVAFLTAYHGLVDLAELRAGERVLVHAAAGGVGTAAVQLARHLGAEVFGTASEGKWPALRAAGLADDHIASSRTTEFEKSFSDGSDGVDVVLNSLSGEFVGAGLRSLRAGGRFVEMGKTDLRDPETAGRDHPGTRYTAFDLSAVSADRVGEILGELARLFAGGVLEPPRVTTWHVREAPQALRALSQAAITGKAVLTFDAGDGTVILTGGTGRLGLLVARHLLRRHGFRHLVLTSRSGTTTPEVLELAAEASGLGGAVTVSACDVGDRAAVAGLLAEVGARHPIAGVVHLAGITDDATLDSLDPDRLRRVLAPKVDGAWHLHELTEPMNLSLFVLFSSAAGTFGSAGQAGYAAGNAFLDGLARHRHRHGLPGTSLAWGLWAAASGMTGHLEERDRRRLGRGGALPLETAEGLALLDAALGAGNPALVTARLDLAGLRRQTQPVPALLRDLVRPATRRAAEFVGDGDALRERLARMSRPDRLDLLVEMVRRHVATVLGHTDPKSVGLDKSFRDLGFDSLTSVELRNRLAAETGLRLPVSLVFDHPRTSALAEHLSAQLVPDDADAGATADPDDGIRQALAAIPVARLRQAGLLDPLLDLARTPDSETPEPPPDGTDRILEADDSELVRLALASLGKD